MKQQDIKVWDLLVRSFHWMLVFAYTLSFVTAEEWSGVHAFSGYVILGLLITRVVWGLVGSHYARFAEFVKPLAVVRSYMQDVLQLKGRRYIGHNPAGGWMIIALLVVLSLTAVTGLFAYAGEDQAGPLFAYVGHWPEYVLDGFAEVHEGLANFSLFLIFVHVCGVVVESFLHDENLVRAMWTGRKRA